ncbi:unnamed protein product, partial [Didymodactylos carnosus]
MRLNNNILSVCLIIILGCLYCHGAQATNSTNCTQLNIDTELNQTELAISKLIVEDYCNLTKDQITQLVMDNYGEYVRSIDIEIKNTTNSVSVSYLITFACNYTQTTTSSSGTTQNTTKTTNVNTQQATSAIAAGISDRTSQVSTKADQYAAGCNDTTMNFDMGDNKTFSIAIITTNQSWTDGMTTGRFATDQAYLNAIASVWKTGLLKIYPNQVSDVVVVSKTASGTKWVISLKITLTTSITTDTLRASWRSSITQVWYTILTQYFTSANKNVKVPATVPAKTTTVNVNTNKVAVQSAQTSSASASGTKASGTQSGTSSNTTVTKTATAQQTASGNKTADTGKSTGTSSNTTVTKTETVQQSASGGKTVDTGKSTGQSSNTTVTKTATAQQTAS